MAVPPSGGFGWAQQGTGVEETKAESSGGNTGSDYCAFEKKTVLVMRAPPPDSHRRLNYEASPRPTHCQARLESESRLSDLSKTAGSRQKFSENTCAGHDGLPHPEVFSIRRGETSRRGSGILQLVQQCQRLPDQSCVRLRFDSDTRIPAARCQNGCPPNPVLFGFRVLTMIQPGDCG